MQGQLPPQLQLLKRGLDSFFVKYGFPHCFPGERFSVYGDAKVKLLSKIEMHLPGDKSGPPGIGDVNNSIISYPGKTKPQITMQPLLHLNIPKNDSKSPPV